VVPPDKPTGAVESLELPEFSRILALRSKRVALLLGAGASVSSGLPSAAGLTWEFKRSLYATALNLSPRVVGSIADPIVKQRLQTHFDAQSGSPVLGAEEEYSHYFQLAYPHHDDRRLFIARRVEDASPHYGYLCLAVLLSTGRMRVVWTTNFDDLTERAFGRVTEGMAVSLVTPETSGRLAPTVSDERFPLVVKLHGDFRYENLKNLENEVAHADESLRDAMVAQSTSYGLLVAGYSGRDASVMDCLNEAIEKHQAAAFPEGLFWCIRPEDTRPPAVSRLLDSASTHGIRAHWVVIPNFDDLMSSLYRACELTNPVVDSQLAEGRPQRRGYRLTETSTSTELVKLAAIQVTQYPSSCYRFKANIDSWQQLRAASEAHELITALHGGFVHALGTRNEISSAFERHQLRDLQPEPIGRTDLRRTNSKLLGMFYDAVSAGLARAPYLTVVGGVRRTVLVQDETRLPLRAAAAFSKLGFGASKMVRAEPAGRFSIHEAAEIALEYREDSLWLVFKPTVYLLTEQGDRWVGPGKADLIREEQATRYNKQSSDLVNLWLDLLFGATDGGVLRFSRSAPDSADFVLRRGLPISSHAE